MDYSDKTMDYLAKKCDNSTMKKGINSKNNYIFDDRLNETATADIKIADGFLGQLLYVLPLPLVEQTRKHPLMLPLYVTALGHFPQAVHHYRARPEGCSEHILIVCTKGKGWLEINGKRQHVQAHQALLVPRNTPHIYGANKKNPWTIYWLHFLGSEADYYAACLPPENYVLPVTSSCEKELISLFQKAYAAVAREYSQARLIVLSQISRLLLGTLFFHNRAYSSIHHSTTSHDLRDIIAHIIAHASEPLTLGGLARHAGLSVRTFSRLFQHQTGITPMQYVIQQRIRTACNLLVDAPLTIHEIARRVGYEDPYFFSRIFSQEMGLSPSQYRTTHNPQSPE